MKALRTLENPIPQEKTDFKDLRIFGSSSNDKIGENMLVSRSSVRFEAIEIKPKSKKGYL
jgi:hypothetical protein